MRLLHKDPRHVEIRVAPENLDDLWHLHNLIDVGDVVEAWTFRTRDIKDDKLRGEKVGKERMKLAIRVEQVEFAEFADRLRLHGTIVEGPQDLGAHHTLVVEPDPRYDLRIAKPRGIQDHHYQRIKEAQEAAKRPLVALVAMDDEEATVAILRQYGVQTVAQIRGRTGSGKMYPGSEKPDEYYGQVLAALRHAKPVDAPLVVVGPGFAREHFLEFARSREPGLLKGMVTEGTGQAGAVGIQEALKRGIVERIQAQQQVARDTVLVEELLAEIGKDGLATYGPDHVRRALEGGAVRLLLVSDEVMRTPAGEDLLKLSKSMAAESHIVATTHEAGRKLHALGGVAALLRYRGA